MIDGAKINMGGKEFIVPPLSLKLIKKLGPQLELMNKVGTQYELLPALAEIVLAALNRNYPELTSDDIDDMLDMGNATAAINAILGQSGFAPAGEAKAAEASPSTGTTSTAS